MNKGDFSNELQSHFIDSRKSEVVHESKSDPN